jgi:hypothetical protein
MTVLSRRDVRKPLVEALSRLGWSSVQIGNGIGWSGQTIKIDLRSWGGADVLFPERPRTLRAVYTATLRYYALHYDFDNAQSGLEDPVGSAVEAHLEMGQLRAVCQGMSRAYKELCTPICSPELQGYVDLAKDLIDFADQPDIDMFEDWLRAVRDHEVETPGSTSEAINSFTEFFGAQCNRGALMIHAPEALRDLIEGWLIGLAIKDVLYDGRSAVVITGLYGLRGQPKQSLAEIGQVIKVTREFVRQINLRVIRFWRRPSYACQIRRHVRTVDMLEDQLASAEQALVARDASIEELECRIENVCDASRGDIDLLKLNELLEAESRRRPQKNLSKRIDQLELTARSENCLSRDGIEYVWQLVEKTEAELMKINNFGRKSLNEIKEVLAQLGLHLGMRLNELLGKDASR